jgi:DNA-binding LacI/PurR family transcriptional regulator
VKIKEIAEALKLSTATVSRVLNEKAGVHPATKDRILGYVRSLEGSDGGDQYRLRTIGIVDTYSRHKINGYYLADILEGADERIHAYDYTTMLIHSDQIEIEAMRYGRVRIFEHLSGLLWLEPMFNGRYEAIVKERGIPCVVINNCEEGLEAYLVKSDNYSSAKKAVNFLASTGHRRIAFVGGYLDLSNHRDRYRGYADGLEAEGLELDAGLVVDDVTSWDEDGGAEGTYRLLARTREIDAIILCSDFLALGAYKVLGARGIAIPDEVSIVSFDDSPLAPYIKPSLSSFRQPLTEIGIKAANLLFELISSTGRESSGRGPSGRDPPEKRVVSIHCPFMVRDSIRPKKER